MTGGGVNFLDHTADVGIDVAAASLPELFHRAATGMLALLRGDDDAAQPARGPTPDDPPPDRQTARVDLEADNAVELLAAWLRELLFLHEVRRRDYLEARFDGLDERRLSASVDTRPSPPAVREIKGVTYHELAVHRGADGWTARVIFDV